ncbi:MAG: zinc ribbon domain-containing protein [Acidobacteriota bacterium]|nr:zinc ribbon domain-containing protein [Acidobacteriota bacterium]
MSSATSTNSEKKSFRQAEATGAAATNMEAAKRQGSEPAARPDEAFKPWHFFVLASLAAATAAVVMARQAAPEHLVLISLTIGAAGAAAAAFYGMLVPLAADEATLVSERQSARARTALEREKALVLRSIKELEFDRAMGKVSPHDFDEMSARLRARAMMLIRQADEGGGGYRELIERELSARLVSRGRGSRPHTSEAAFDEDLAARAARSSGASAPQTAMQVSGGNSDDGRQCPACSTGNDTDAAFCKRCGLRLEAQTA